MKIGIQDSRRALLLALGDRTWRQRDPDSQRMQDGQNLADLAGFLALAQSQEKITVREEFK
jgi:hypothetical protein